ncbi:SET and MYND domain-containing protein 4 [Anoplophora glabripennis]|uniref:SET and MYND domain-containing protein 4 n=1 Tax=Anoplophora glabripennis TaxID=217634 RepID=UPI00087494BE|nr:SET and MYND domain-containing protein 4 [Anoplophora glabripennis]XP_018564420.1 SET and MYND domain-containing protein 4 [Anoplophora glabripennis]
MDYTKNLDNIVEQLLHHLSAKKLVAATSKLFSILETNSERVDFAYRLLDEYHLLPALSEDLKNNDLAAKIRQKGNEMFKVKKNGEAIELYTQSVALAADGSEYLALAYANRSAVLFERGFYRECLKDIDQALKNNYPENLKPKLLKRREKANDLKGKQLIRNYFEPIPEIPENQKNTLIQCASDSIEIKRTENQGRHVGATRDIMVGEILAVEKPFCHILIERFYNHCHNCLKLCYNLIPCVRCTQVMYCDVKCRDNDDGYHKYECRILATVRKLNIDKLKLLPLKIALLVKDKYPIIKEMDNTEEGLYHSDRYKEIHNLIPNTSSRSVSDMFDRSSTSAIIFHLIKKFTDFFQSEEEETIFKDLILLHMQTSACNFHEISELAENDIGIYEPDEIGAGAYSFLSMFNHRCSPNVLRDCYGPVVVIRAIENIKKGQQCYDNYGYHYAVMSKPDRKAKLKKQYFFDCTCEVCENDWPLYQNLREIQTNICIEPDDISNLQNGNVEAAKEILAKMLPKMKELEKVKPNRNLANVQEIVKQCFALLGNVRKTL